MPLPRSLLPLWLPLILALPAVAASPPGAAGAEDDEEAAEIERADRAEGDDRDAAEAAEEQGHEASAPFDDEGDDEGEDDNEELTAPEPSMLEGDDDDDDGQADGVLADRCPELTGPTRRHERHARWRARHRMDVDFGGSGWEIAMRGDVPQQVRTGLFEGATIINVQPVSSEAGGAVEWVAVVDLAGDLAQLCDADQVELRLDDAFGRGAHVIALHHEGVLLRDRDNELVFLSAEDSEQVPTIELVYSSSFQLVNAPKVSKAKKKKRKKRRRRRRRR